MKTTVIFDSITKRVLVIGCNDVWALPKDLDVVVFNDTEPVLYENASGDVLIKDDAFYIPGGVL